MNVGWEVLSVLIGFAIAVPIVVLIGWAAARYLDKHDQ